MQQDKSVVENWQKEVSQEVELDGYLVREPASYLPPQGRPCNAVGGATGHMIHVDIIRNLNLLKIKNILSLLSNGIYLWRITREG